MGRNPEKLECDLVMRGGITSGIVYPRAIAKLAETYNFRSIGGTSAGAIAAAATAAAQFGANNGDDRFQTIYELPKKLAELKDGKSTLERLFQPQPGTSRLFSLLMSGLKREGTVQEDPPHRHDRTLQIIGVIPLPVRQSRSSRSSGWQAPAGSAACRARC